MSASAATPLAALLLGGDGAGEPGQRCLQGGLGDGRLGEGRHAAAVQAGQDVPGGFFEDVVGGVGEVEQDAQEGHEVG